MQRQSCAQEQLNILPLPILSLQVETVFFLKEQVETASNSVSTGVK
jgi:hypothetical protein